MKTEHTLCAMLSYPYSYSANLVAEATDIEANCLWPHER